MVSGSSASRAASSRFQSGSPLSMSALTSPAAWFSSPMELPGGRVSYSPSRTASTLISMPHSAVPILASASASSRSVIGREKPSYPYGCFFTSTVNTGSNPLFLWVGPPFSGCGSFSGCLLSTNPPSVKQPYLCWRLAPYNP